MGFLDSRLISLRHYVTVKTPELTAVPPGVVMAILPVTAPLGTVAFTWVSLTTVTVVAFTPSKVTFVVRLRLTPVMVTPFHRTADRREARNLRYDEEFPVAGQHAAGSGHSYGTRRRSAREARGVKAAAGCRIPKRLRARRLSGPP